ISPNSQIWMSHGDTITRIPEKFKLLAGTESIDVAAFKSDNGSFGAPVYCIQFHREVTHSLEGKTILRNFVIDIAGCTGNWTPAAFVENTVNELREKLGGEKVLMALSGGVDSTVGAMLLHKAIGKNLVCFFVDNGL